MTESKSDEIMVRSAGYLECFVRVLRVIRIVANACAVVGKHRDTEIEQKQLQNDSTINIHLVFQICADTPRQKLIALMFVLDVCRFGSLRIVHQADH